jgi:SAM-dependent methyltransferase
MTEELEIPLEFRRGYLKTESVVRRSAFFSLNHMRARLGLDSFEGVEMLDVGCGTKFTQALLENEMPIGRYVGVDVFRDMIEFLRATVDDPRFEYHHADIHNARYNPAGAELTDDARLPFEAGQDFDLICLFSVFTHLEPRDYAAMLRLLRRYVKADGRLFYTLFIDEETEGGHGMMDAYKRRFGDAAVGQTDAFQDLVPSDTLAYALYTREHALELIAGTGWEVLTVEPPNEHMQHQIICRPA